MGDTINSVMGVVHYYYGEYVIYPGDLSYFSFDDSASCTIGDINQDNTVNVVDIVQAVNYVLGMISSNFQPEKLFFVSKKKETLVKFGIEK